MTVALAPWHVGIEEHLSGSIFASTPGRRIDAARALVAAGIGVHVDVMAPGEGLPEGVTAEELAELAEELPAACLDVHLIGSPDGARALLPSIPECRVLHVPFGVHADTAGQLWAAVWNELDAATVTASDIAGYDGVLVMLLEPGTSGAADPARLALVESMSGFVAAGVDGGVTPDLIPHCRSAGATTIVVGRALLEGQP